MLYKRGKTYWIDIQVGGRRVRRSTGTDDKARAKEFHRKAEADAYAVNKLGAKPKRSFEEAAVRWLNEKAHKKSIADDAERIVFWRDKCEGMTLDQVTSTFVQDAVANLKTRHGHPAAAATKNRYSALMRAILRKAVRWGFIDIAPPIDMLPENNKRVSYFTPEQARQFMAHLPQQHKAPVALAFMTGLRKSNVYGLRWDQIDLKRNVAWVHGDEAKAGRNITVPLNTDAQALLAGLWDRRRASDVRVFEGVRPILTKAWRRCLKEAGLPTHLRFHDTRHSFASWHIMAGTDKKTLQELAGWTSPAMLERYVHLTDDHLADAAQRLAGYISVTPDSDSVQEPHVTH